jgi:hypothetical protein
MTRIEWMRGLDEALRRKIIARIVDGNANVDFIDQWLQSDVDIKEDGITGAFTFSTTREGLTYWERINANIK